MSRFKFLSITKILVLMMILSLGYPLLVSSEEKHGGDISFKDTKKFAPVIFSHDKHMQTGNQCADCHDSLFQKKAGATDTGNAITMKTMKTGKFCGACHDGQKSFSVNGSCKKCHQPYSLKKFG
jgi:c(7)-type cytochrome triheme protein